RMRQNLCRRTTKSMTDATADIAGVGEAKGWANRIIAANHRGPGDTVDAALHRAAVKHGLDPKLLWRLRYRTPKHMLVSSWKRIQQAYESECDRQKAKLRHELEFRKALLVSAVGFALIADKEALMAAKDSYTEGETAQPADSAAHR